MHPTPSVTGIAHKVSRAFAALAVHKEARVPREVGECRPIGGGTDAEGGGEEESADVEVHG